MERPGFGVHLWLLLLIQVAMWTVPCVSVDLGDSCTDNASCTVANSVCVTLCQCEDSHYQSSNTTCTKRVNVGQPCTPDGAGGQGKCVTGAVCDADNTCRAQSDLNCSADSSGCPKSTTCDTNNNICACDSGYYDNNKMCLPRKPVGQQCTGSAGSQENCVTGAVCDSGSTCRAQSDQNCAADPSGCLQSTTCDSNSNMCACDIEYYANSKMCLPRIALGETCSSSSGNQENCITGAVCDTDSNCRLPVQAACTPGTDHCRSGSKCVNVGSPQTPDNKCRMTAGSSLDCSNDDNCVPSARCDGNKCRIRLGESCSGNEQNCVTAAVCDSDTCRLPVQAACTPSTPGTDLCRSGSKCVNVGSQTPDYKCRMPAGSSLDCSNDDNCVPSARCDGNTCRIRLGESCSGNDQNCVTAAVCDSDTCRLRVQAACTPSTPGTDLCRSGSKCVNVGSQTPDYKCRMTVGSSLDCSSDDNCVPSALCDGTKCRKIYGSNCNAGDECQNTKNENCSSDGSSPQKCLCSSGFFRSNNNVCTSVTSLKVGGLNQTGDKEETSIMVQWTKPTMVNTAEYNASLDQPGGAWSPNLTASFSSGLTPGEEYTVTVSTRTKKDPQYGDTMVQNDNSGSLKVFTKPAIPGKLILEYHKVPRVTLKFDPSTSPVDKYSVTVHGTTQNVSSSSPLSATFTHLGAETNYTVTIVAWRHEISSDVQTDIFYVDAAGAEEVSNLRVLQHGGRWSEVTWGKPVEPNGDITGYTVRMMNGTCVSGVAVFCSDCGSSGSSTPSVSRCARQSRISMTSSELDSGVQVNVTDLLPDVNYTVLVNAYNQKGRGTDTENYVITNQEAALTLNAVTLTTPEVKQLLVSWEPAERTGPTTYTVSWSEKQSLTSNAFVPKGSVNISGYENRSYLIEGLLSYWDYKVSVFPFTRFSDPQANVTTEKQRTSPTEPGVVNFTITQSNDTAQNVVLTAQCPEEKERNGKIVFISYTATVTQQGAYTKDPPVGNITVTGDCEVGPHQIDVVAEASYNFTVFAKTSTNHDGNSTTQQITIAARRPTLRPSGSAKELAVGGTSTSSQVTVELCPCVVSPDQGHIVLAGITLCVETQTTTTECIASKDISKLQQSKYQGLPSWKQFMKNGAKGQYRVTSDDFQEVIAAASRTRRSVSRRQARSTAGFVSFTIGDNTSCDSLDENVFCNGPLPEGKEFQLIIWACTRDGCTEADGVTISTLSGNGVDIGPIIGAVIAVVAIAALVAVIVVVVLRHRQMACFDKPSSTGSPGPSTPVNRSVSLRGFAARLEILHKDSNLLFQEEYEEIQDKSPKHYSQDAATLDVNKVKNRYVNILPFDHTRVKLSTDDDDDSSDFINANYIPGYKSPREYIATQGPMVGTVNDFWRMVWEQKSSLIVMLSDLQEKGRPKVDMYWPGELQNPVQYGDIVVEMTTSSTLQRYTIRTFDIYKEDQKEDVRRIAQYFIPGWEDYSANLSSDDALDFISATRQEARSSQGPIIVHCSAGVGRTGTFVAVDFLMQYVQGHSLDEEVDIYNLVLNMRHNRPYMVQSEKQYIFIHDTLKMIIERKIQSMEDDHIYGNTITTDDIYVNQAFEPDDNLYENTSYKPTTSL